MSYLDGMTVADRDDLEREVFHHRMRDTLGGYDWGDPIVLWTWPRLPRVPSFTLEQLAVAHRASGWAS